MTTSSTTYQKLLNSTGIVLILNKILHKLLQIHKKVDQNSMLKM